MLVSFKNGITSENRKLPKANNLFLNSLVICHFLLVVFQNLYSPKKKRKFIYKKNKRSNIMRSEHIF